MDYLRKISLKWQVKWTHTRKSQLFKTCFYNLNILLAIKETKSIPQRNIRDKVTTKILLNIIISKYNPGIYFFKNYTSQSELIPEM